MQDQLDTLVVRKVNKRTYRRFRQTALKEDTNMGQAVSEAMEYWLRIKEKKKKIDIKGILRLNGLIRAGKKVKWSAQIDKALYGDRS